MYILGDVFLRNYLSIYDFDNNRVGVALHIYSNATVRKGPFPGWAIALIVVGGILVIGVVAYCFWRRHKNKKRKAAMHHY